MLLARNDNSRKDYLVPQVLDQIIMHTLKGITARCCYDPAPSAIIIVRVGYGIFPLEIIKHLWKIKQPYNVNVAAQAAVLASLEDIDCLRAKVERIIVERERLYASLQDIEYLRPYPSQSNFILCRVIGREAGELKRTLEREGILVRYYRKPGLRDCIRISVGKPEQNEALLAALRRLTSRLGQGNGFAQEDQRES